MEAGLTSLGGGGQGGAFLSIKCIVYCILSPKP